MHSAFSGTKAQAGPPVDLCLQLLDCMTLPSGMVRSSILKNVTDSDFYPYQVSGSVGVILKLYGHIDTEKLLKATCFVDDPRAEKIREAGEKLRDICIHGCFLADDVGFGKTKQLLLAAFIHSQLANEASGSEILYKPILLIVPPALVNQWLKELRDHWPYFDIIISYEDHEFKEAMSLSSLSHTAMAEYPSLEAVPHNLRYVWNTADPQAARTIILTSYETHKSRVGVKKTRSIPGVPYKKPRYGPDGTMIWKKEPRVIEYWETNQEGVYSLLMADEAQKMRNYGTGIWSILYLHGFRKTLLATATPIFNTLKVSSLCSYYLVLA
jgi:SNF2 family DNA or RNA helicase